MKLPLLEEFELATAMAFDLGVFLCVVGSVMLALARLSRVGRIAEHLKIQEGAMDVDPSRYVVDDPRPAAGSAPVAAQ